MTIDHSAENFIGALRSKIYTFPCSWEERIKKNSSLFELYSPIKELKKESCHLSDIQIKNEDLDDDEMETKTSDINNLPAEDGEQQMLEGYPLQSHITQFNESHEEGKLTEVHLPPDAELEAETENEGEPEAESEREREAEPEPDSEALRESETNSQPLALTQSDTKNEPQTEENESQVISEEKSETQQASQFEHKPRIIVKHSILGNRIPSHDQNVLVESTTFTSIGKIQPFLITISTNAALVMDFHCHLTTSEVVGYLAGNWDVNSHNLNITHAFPCKCRLGDYESAPLIENEVRKTIKSNRLTLVGWYHSHPTAPATPSLRDIDTQLDYELRMKGSSDSSYLPCIGVICSPYNASNTSLESNIVSYWVIPPPENRIHEYGKPMMMSYSVLQDHSISHEVLLEMKKCADFYKPEKDYVKFSETLKDNITYLEKLKSSVSSKFPLNHQKTETLWNYLEDVISTTSEKTETEILKQIIEISSTPGASTPVPEKTKFNIPNIPPLLGYKSNSANSHSNSTSNSYKDIENNDSVNNNSNSINNNGNNNNNTSNSINNIINDNSSNNSSSSSPSNAHFQKSHSRSKSSSKRSNSRDSKNLASLSNYFVGSDLASALFGSGKFPMGLDPATKSLLNLNSLSLGSMFLPPMSAYKPDPNVGLMKPPPPPSSYYSYSSSRSSGSRSSPSSASSSRSHSRSMPSTSRDMPPPNKVPKLDVHPSMANFFIPPNLGKNCTITSRPSTSSNK